MEYDLFLGCLIPARLPFLESSSRLIFKKMGIKLNDIDGFSCCPDPTGIEQIDHDTWMTLGARNLSLSNNGNGGILSFCSGCVETLKGVNYHFQKDEKLQTKINEILKKIGRKYDGSTNVKHFGQVLYENLDLVKENIVKPLNGFKVAVHYGCHYLRPSEIINWDDPFKPTTIDTILEFLGAETIDYDLKLECCGNPVEKSDKNLSLLMIENKFKSIMKSGANCVALVCPACYQQFDFNQRELNNSNKTNYNFPIFYLSELVALAFGINPKDIGIKYHRIKPDNLFRETKFPE